MQFVEDISLLYKEFPRQGELLIAFLATAALVVFFKKKDQISRHALENILTTLAILGFNCIVIIGFLDEINLAMQSAYHALGVPTLDPDVWKDTPVLLTCLIAIAAKDFADYWNHRFMHTRLGWPAHAAHHSDTHVNAFTSLRVHFVELIIMTASYVTLLTWMQIPEAIPVVLLFSTAHNMYVHLDLDWHHGPFRFLIASPRFHRWHHADTPEAYGKNLANVMPIYDLVFGTYREPGPCREKMGALDTGVADKDAAALIAFPFLEWTGMIRRALGSKRVEKDDAEAKVL